MIENFELLAEGQLAGDLTAAEVRTFTAHLSVCPECKARFEAHRAAAAQLASLATAPLAAMSAGFTDKLMRALPKGPPPGGAAPAAGTGMIVLAIGAAVVIAGAVALAARTRTTPAAVPSPGASAAPSATASLAPSPSASPSPLPSIARPSNSVGGLDDDGTSGRTSH